MNNPPTGVEVATRPTVSTKLAYGLIGSVAIFAFTFFWGNVVDYSRQLDASIPSAQAAAQPSVHELTVRLLNNPNAPAERVATLVDQRRAALLKLAASNPTEARQAILAGAIVEKLPASAQAAIERATTDEGVLEVMHYDADLDLGVARNEYFLVKNNQRIRLHTADVEELQVKANAKVKIHGFQIDETNILLAETANETGVPTASVEVLAAAEAITVTERKVAVILFNFQNDTRQNYTPAQAKSIVFGASASVNAYDQEASFGQLRLVGKNDVTGDVLGWYTIPHDNTSCSTNYRTWSNAARDAATAAGNDLTGYDHFIYGMSSASGCPGAGWAESNSDESWINGGSFRTAVVAHEHGHNLGNWHASSYACTDASGARTQTSATCTASEYGDPFDIMGNHGAMRHFSAGHKYQVGFLTATNVQDVTADGVYTIYPIEQLGATPHALRLPRDVNSSGIVSRQYWIDYRRPSGSFDNYGASDPAVNGVMIRSLRNRATFGGGTSNSLLFDATPSTTSFTDAPLAVGRTFDDTTYGIRIETLEAAADHATVRVSFIQAVCVRGTPNVTITPPASIYANAGQALPYNMAVTNTDSPACAPAAVEVTPTLPANWTQTPSSVNLTLNPGQTSYTTLMIASSATEVPGTYTITETAVNTASNLSRSVSTSYIVNGPDVTSPTVSISSPANNATLKGKNFKIQAAASDTSGIAKIDLAIDGVIKQTCLNVTSCSYTGLVSSLSAGTHTIIATATDASANANTGVATVTVKK